MKLPIAASCLAFSLFNVSYGNETFEYIKTEPKLNLTTESELSIGKQKNEEEIRSDWGLALSGGGFRSSLFMIGVLKGLYTKQIGNQHFLEKIDMVSSVSGGGYAAYWLYSDPNLDTDGFGVGRLSSDNFTDSTCSILLNSNFVTNQAAIGNVFSSVDLYENSILRTFGPYSSRFIPPSANELETAKKKKISTVPFSSIEQSSHKIPYHIVNTSITDKSLEWKDRLFEFTPLTFGNPYTDGGQKLWGDNESIGYLKTIAISGAATEFLLRQTVTLQSANPQPPTTVTLADGGKTENLGAYALIRRGVKNIIIVDAEHDPNYAFGAFRNLKDQLEKDHYIINVKELNNYIDPEPTNSQGSKVERMPIENAVYYGYVSKNGEEQDINKRIAIYYIKMAVSNSISELINSKANEDIKAGERINKLAYDKLKEQALKQNQKNWDCSALKNLKLKEQPNALENWYAYNLQSYAKAFPSFIRVKIANRFGIEGWTSTFPHYSTWDQSFYHDQAVAFMALGYFATKELRIPQ